MRLPAVFNNKEFYKKLFAIAVPIMLQNFINSFVNVVDTVMIGRLGTVEIAAVGLGNNVFFFYMIILFGICSGGSVFIAQFWGKRDLPGIRRTVGLCIVISLFIGAIFTLGIVCKPDWIIGIYSQDPAVIETGARYLRYLAPSFLPFAIGQVFFLSLRAVEQVKAPMVTTLIALSINVVLNWLWIFGIGPFPVMGVAGAASATVVARFTEAVLLVGISYRRKFAIAGPLREMFAFNAAFVSRFARTHTDAIAAFNITGTVSQLTWVLFIGLGSGIGVLIGKKIGEGDHAAARDYAFRILCFAPLVAVGAAGVLIPASRAIPLIFKVNTEVLIAAAQMMVILACVYPLRAFNMSMVVGICRAGGDTVFCAVYDVAFMWIISLPSAAIASFVFHAPFWFIYLLVLSEELFKFGTGLWRFRSGKWLHDVTTGL
ncbi:MAG: polysaccharide biosynthesis C-terminal domain-containing protein [Treponema sp.]|jgi:Na+-driven multidrug efflux pump|nr:polysaccharide biosynthesis C-terminal domain-containing protein [Treponema sp.]